MNRPRSPGRPAGDLRSHAMPYLLFGGTDPTVRGGSHDLIGIFGSEAEVKEAFQHHRDSHCSRGGWAEAVVVDGTGVRHLCWFGSDRADRRRGSGAEARAALAPGARWLRWRRNALGAAPAPRGLDDVQSRTRRYSSGAS